jgi:hypothetical protein
MANILQLVHLGRLVMLSNGLRARKGNRLIGILCYGSWLPASTHIEPKI